MKVNKHVEIRNNENILLLKYFVFFDLIVSEIKIADNIENKKLCKGRSLGKSKEEIIT
tara:strand:+ start:1148 stop:1321 length:174 start_codon:yes stop_codon:yes gene_type:complete